MATRRRTIDQSAFEHILNVTRRLASTNDLHEVLALIIDGLRDALRADRASVFQYDATDHVLFATEAHGLSADLRLPADLGIVGEAGRTRAVINIPNAYADTRFNPDVDKSTGFKTRCLLTVPMVDPDGKLIGVAQVLNKSLDDGGTFDAEDEKVAQMLADQAAVALKRAALLEDQRQKEKLEADLQIARKIQRSALPQTIPTFEGYDIAARFQPADETGGDAYDVIDLNAHRMEESGDAVSDAFIFMGDATGHGVGPALSVVQVLAMARMGCRLDVPVDDIAFHINERLCTDLPVGRFVTAFLGQLDVEKHQLHWVSAGQAPLVFIPAKGDESIFNSNGMPFGIDENFQPDPVEPFRFEPGDLFLLMSDGYYEASNASGEMYGHARAIACARLNRAKSASEIIDAIMADLVAFTAGKPPDDDQTAVIVKRMP